MPVWQNAFSLLLRVYKITKVFPQDEKFGIIPDMRRAANSVVHNISEGFGRYERLDKSRFYKISRGSSYELISQTMTSFSLGFIKDKEEKESVIQAYREVIDELDSFYKKHRNCQKIEMEYITGKITKN